MTNTNTTEKMTNKKALTYVLETFELPKAVKEKLEVMIVQLDKKNGAERKPTKTQLENENYKKMILEFMTETKVTVTDIQKSIEELNDFSNQKVARLVKDLYDGGLIKKEVVKGRSYFFIQKSAEKSAFSKSQVVEKWKIELIF